MGVVIAANARTTSTETSSATGTTFRKPTAIDENGELVNGVGDQPNQHDISDGLGFTRTCAPWRCKHDHV